MLKSSPSAQPRPSTTLILQLFPPSKKFEIPHPTTRTNKSQGAHLRLKDEHDWRKRQELLHQSYRGLHDSRLPGRRRESPPRGPHPICFGEKKNSPENGGGFSGLHPDFEENGCHLCQQKEDQKLARVDILPSFCHYRPDRIRKPPILEKLKASEKEKDLFKSHVDNYFLNIFGKITKQKILHHILQGNIVLCILVLLLIYLFFRSTTSHYSKIPALRFGCPQCTSPSVTLLQSNWMLSTEISKMKQNLHFWRSQNLRHLLYGEVICIFTAVQEYQQPNQSQ